MPVLSFLGVHMDSKLALLCVTGVPAREIIVDSGQKPYFQSSHSRSRSNKATVQEINLTDG